MMNSNFVKEIFWKNDLTYLCLAFPLVLFLIKDKSIFLIASFSVIISVTLAFSWFSSVKKRYILNSSAKIPIMATVISLTTLNIIPIENASMQFIIGTLNIACLSFYSLFVVITAFYFYENADEHYEGEYYPEYEDSYRTNSYRRSIYSVLKWNNTIEYHYDRNIDAYLCGGTFYKNIVHYCFGFGVSYPMAQSGMVAMFHITDYMNYLHETGLPAHKVTDDDLAVFKMLMI